MKKVRVPLSKREDQIWVYLLGYFVDHGYSPTRMEIAEALGISSNQQVTKCLRNMQKKGWIELGGHRWRNIIDPKDYGKNKSKNFV